MDVFCSTAIDGLRQLFATSRTAIEGEFSPYFYRYFIRYFRNPQKFDGYLELCQYLFKVTKGTDASVLDLGCGFGLMATIFGLYGSKEVVGYDLNPEKIELFQKLLLYLDPGIRNVKPRLGDSSKIEYPDEYFDVVLANETLSHVRQMEESIGEVYRVLKTGGYFLIRDGNNALFLLGRIRRRRFWRRIELGPVDPLSFRSTDIPLPYFEVRRNIIVEKFPQMDSEKVNFLSRETSGMFGDEIFEALQEFEKMGKISKRPKFRYRNPLTGEFPEKEINPFSLRRVLREIGFDISFIPYYYSTSFNNAEMMIKRFFYWMENHIPKLHLFLTPGFALLGKKRRP